MGQTGLCEEKGGDYPRGWDRPTPHSHGPSTYSSETSFQRPGGPEDALRAQCFFIDRFDCIFISLCSLLTCLFHPNPEKIKSANTAVDLITRISRLVCCLPLLDFRGIKQQLSAIKVLEGSGNLL